MFLTVEICVHTLYSKLKFEFEFENIQLLKLGLTLIEHNLF